jgi:hypothetical protein
MSFSMGFNGNWCSRLPMMAQDYQAAGNNHFDDPLIWIFKLRWYVRSVQGF